MPFEIMVIIIVAIIAGTVSGIARQALRYQQQRDSRTADGQGASLTTSQLEALMRKAVAEATEPLAEKIEALQAQLETTQHEARPPLLGEGEAMEDLEPRQSVRRPRTVR